MSNSVSMGISKHVHKSRHKPSSLDAVSLHRCTDSLSFFKCRRVYREKPFRSWDLWCSRFHGAAFFSEDSSWPGGTSWICSSWRCLCVHRGDLDGDSGVCSVLGDSQRGDWGPDPLQRTGLCGRSSPGAEGEAGLNVCVWTAAGLRRAPCLALGLQAASPCLEPLLTPGWSRGFWWEQNGQGVRPSAGLAVVHTERSLWLLRPETGRWQKHSHIPGCSAATRRGSCWFWFRSDQRRWLQRNTEL